MRTLVVYAFSTENWSRPADEVAALMEILGETIERELPDLATQGVRTRFLGRRDRVPEDRREQMGELERVDRAPRHALPSGSRSTTAAGRRSSRRRDAASRTASLPEAVDETALAARLYAPELAEIDLLIRTSGEFRTSNFLLWETAYAELVFTDTLWPDFGADDLRAALDTFAARERRFGGR